MREIIADTTSNRFLQDHSCELRLSKEVASGDWQVVFVQKWRNFTWHRKEVDRDK